jgi:putative ABC transport system permease protein
MSASAGNVSGDDQGGSAVTVRDSTNMSLVRWSWKEIRQGQLLLAVGAFILIIASVFALAAIAQRMEQVVDRQGKEALMADTVFISANPVSPQVYSAVHTLGIQTSLMTRFPTMLFSRNSMKLAMVKAVDEGFPLQGKLILSDGVDEKNHIAPGEVWLAKQLFSDLGVQIGDSITIGDMTRKITGVVLEDPGLSFNPFRQMSTVFIHQSDVPKTGALKTGSRVQYRLFINAPDPIIRQLKKQITLTPSDEWRDVNQTSRTSVIFNNAIIYLSLVVVIVVVMAAMTLLFTCQFYATSRKSTVAMLKSLGASKRWLMRWLVIQMLMLIGLALCLGIPLGYLLEWGLRIPLADLLPSPLPSLGITPFLTALLCCCLVAVPGMGIPLYRLLDVPAVAAVQASGFEHKKARLSFILSLFPLLGAIYFWGEHLMLWLVLGGIIILSIILAAVCFMVFRVIAVLPLPAAFQLAFKRIRRSPWMSGIQLSILSLSLMLFSVLWVVRMDLLSDWTGIFPPNAPNVFAINISPSDKDAYVRELEHLKINHSPIFPMVRGRLSLINGIDAKKYAGGEKRSDIFRREVNFTWADHPPGYNTIVKGTWTQSQGVSVESKVARDLGIKLGDTLTFVVNSESIKARVNTIRQVEWRELQPNFYFIFTPDIASNLPATWLLSFRVGSNADHDLSVLARTFPTVSLIDLRHVTQKIQRLLSQIIKAISILTSMGVVAGLLLIYTLLRLSLSQRQAEMVLYRTLGMGRRRLTWTVLAEFGCIGVIAGLVSAIGADGLVATIMTYGFDLSPSPHFMLFYTQPLVALIMVMLVVGGLLRHLLKTSYQQMNSVNIE